MGQRVTALPFFITNKEKCMFNDFEEKYSPKTLNDIVFHSVNAKQTVEDIVSGLVGFPTG